MRSQLDIDQQAQLSKLTVEHGLSEKLQELLAIGKSCVQLAGLGPDRLEKVGDCRLGGLPDVPSDFVWPGKMSFIAQLNLSAISPLAPAGLLPAQGMLYFFLGDDEAPDNLPIAVIHADATMGELRRAVAPDGYVEVTSQEYDSGDANVIYEPYALTTARCVSLPSYGSPLFWKVLGDIPTKMVTDAYFAIGDALGIQIPSRRIGRHQLFGYAIAADRDPAVLACYKRHGVHSDFYWLERPRLEKLILELESQSERSRHDEYLLKKRREQLEELMRCGPREELKQEAEQDWVLLLELDSDLNAGMCFWDAGHIQFMIHERDLRERRFDRVLAFLFTS